MKTKLLKSSTALLGAIVLSLALGACAKTRDSTADTGSSSGADSVASNDAANNSGAATPATSGNIADTQSSAASDLPAVNPNPPVSAVEVALMSDPALSSAAKNIQISADNNKLVLRGSVPSNELKIKMEEKAREVAVGTQIDNQITVSSQQ